MNVRNAIAVAVSLAFVGSWAGAQGTDSGSAFVDAVKKSDGAKVDSLLKQSGKSKIVDSRDYDGNTGLLIAIARRDADYTGFLLNSGADPNLAGKGGETPLVAAARAGFDDAVGWLIGLGARVNVANRAGETPLIVAVQNRETVIAQLLLKSGADPDRQDSVAGLSARDYAKRDPRARDILKLIEATKPAAAKAN